MSIKVNVSQSEMNKILSCIKGIAGGVSENDIVEIVLKAPEQKEKVYESKKPEATMTSREVADVLGRQHAEVMKQISRLLYVGGLDGEKEGFSLSSFVCSHRNHKSYPMYLMTEEACKKYRELVAKNGSGIKMVDEALKRYDRAIAEKFHLVRSAKMCTPMESDFLLEGKPRSEYAEYCSMFNEFITGPAVEGREIAGLTEQYKQFHEAMRQVPLQPKDCNKIESAMYGVAIEAEMQGFIYGFKMFDALLNQSLATA